MIDLGDELAGYGEEDPRREPKPRGDLIKGGHVRLADLQKSGFNVPPSDPFIGPILNQPKVAVYNSDFQPLHTMNPDQSGSAFQPIGTFITDPPTISARAWLPGDDDSDQTSADYTLVMKSDGAEWQRNDILGPYSVPEIFDEFD